MPVASESQFWVVWNPEHGTPKFRHSRAAEAHIEAKRLASAHPGQQFIVLRAESGYQTTDPIQVTDFSEPPF